MSPEGIELITEGFKLGSKIINFSNDIGIKELCKGHMSIILDRVNEKRNANLVEIFKKTVKSFNEVGIPYVIKPVELKISVAILDAASLEEDDFLRTLWANLILNASYENSEVDIRSSFIEVIRQLSPFDAKNLLEIYKLPFEESKNGITTNELPQKALLIKKADKADKTDKTNKEDKKKCYLSDEVELSLQNLDRLGCINAQNTFSPNKDYGLITPTILGRKVIESCTLKFQ
jgi:hypothetical protein